MTTYIFDSIFKGWSFETVRYAELHPCWKPGNIKHLRIAASKGPEHFLYKKMDNESDEEAFKKIKKHINKIEASQ